MKKTTIIFAGLSLLVITSCTNSKMKNQQQEKALFTELMGIHDEIMPRNEDIIKAKRQLSVLSTKMDSVKKANVSLDTSAFNQNIKKAIAELDSADNAMSDWMHDFEPNFDGKSHEEIMKYLEDNKASIEKVKVQFSSSLDNAKKLLNNVK